MLKDIFPTKVYIDFLDKVIFDKVKEGVLAYINQDSSKFKDSWQGNTLTDFPATGFKSKELKDFILRSANNYMTGAAQDNPENFELKISNIWINLNDNNTFQEEHIHLNPPIVHFSGIFYIEEPEQSGELVLITPNKHEMYMPYSHDDQIFQTIKPKESMIIIFPSYLAHKVNQNKGSKRRICISFNLISFHKIKGVEFWTE